MGYRKRKRIIEIEKKKEWRKEGKEETQKEMNKKMKGEGEQRRQW